MKKKDIKRFLFFVLATIGFGDFVSNTKYFFHQASTLRPRRRQMLNLFF
jgi:hypothetical protein